MDSKVIEQLLPPAGSPQSLIFLWVVGRGMRVKTIPKDLYKNSVTILCFLIDKKEIKSYPYIIFPAFKNEV